MKNENTDDRSKKVRPAKGKILQFEELAKKYKKSATKHKNPATKSVTFVYSEAFETAFAIAVSYSLVKLTATAFITCAINELYKLAVCSNVFTQNVVNLTQKNGLDLIPVYTISDRSGTDIVVEGKFHDPSKHADFRPGENKTTLIFEENVVDKLKLFQDLWEEKDRSVVIANIAVIYAMLLHDRFEEDLTPYSDKTLDFGSTMLWRRQI